MQPFEFPAYDNDNGWADFWRYKIGVNVIPAIGWIKKPIVDWKEWQTTPIPEEMHNQWKSQNLFKDGMAIVLGKVWHRKEKEGYYCVGVDGDNALAIKEIIQSESEDLTTFASKTLTEQYEDNPDKFHFLMYCSRPILNKDPDVKKPGIPLIEIKCLRRIMYCTPSPNAKGKPRRIVGTSEPRTLESFDKSDEFETHINSICKKYGLKYLENADNGRVEKNNNNKENGPLIELDDKAIRDICECIRPYFLDGVKDLVVFSLSGFLYKLNVSKDSTIALIELLTNNERKAVSTAEATYKKNRSEVVGYRRLAEILQQPIGNENTVREEIERIQSIATSTIDGDDQGKKSKKKVAEATNVIMNKHHFLTIEESKEILVYENGVYVPGGDIVIEKESDAIFGYELANRDIAEIKGYIMRKTYHTRKEPDSDLNIINVKNGLYNWAADKIQEHTPGYLSTVQLNITHNPEARSKLFGKFLSEVLYPNEIRTAIEMIAYCFYRSNPFEVINILHGSGLNGKSVFTRWITHILKSENVSRVPLRIMLDNTFALSDLEGMAANIDPEMSSATIENAEVLKMITGQEETRIERKNQRAYKTLLHAKMFFSANKIPQTKDDSDAYYRRNVILTFWNKFEGKNDDPDIKNKLTTEDEISGMFNVLMKALRRIILGVKHNDGIIRKGIFINERTIQQRRDKYTRALDPIKAFMNEAIIPYSKENDKAYKDEFYEAYKEYCHEYRLSFKSKNDLSAAIMAHPYYVKDGRDPSGERRYFWKSVRILDKKQRTLFDDELSNPIPSESWDGRVREFF